MASRWGFGASAGGSVWAGAPGTLLAVDNAGVLSYVLADGSLLRVTVRGRAAETGNPALLPSSGAELVAIREDGEVVLAAGTVTAMERLRVALVRSTGKSMAPRRRSLAGTAAAGAGLILFGAALASAVSPGPPTFNPALLNSARFPQLPPHGLPGSCVPGIPAMPPPSPSEDPTAAGSASARPAASPPAPAPAPAPAAPPVFSQPARPVPLGPQTEAVPAPAAESVPPSSLKPSVPVAQAARPGPVVPAVPPVTAPPALAASAPPPAPPTPAPDSLEPGASVVVVARKPSAAPETASTSAAALAPAAPATPPAPVPPPPVRRTVAPHPRTPIAVLPTEAWENAPTSDPHGLPDIPRTDIFAESGGKLHLDPVGGGKGIRTVQDLLSFGLDFNDTPQEPPLGGILPPPPPGPPLAADPNFAPP